jgi:hypothetical protein
VKLKERQGVTAGIVFSVLMTVVNTGRAMAGQRTETFLKTLGACATQGLFYSDSHEVKRTG